VNINELPEMFHQNGDMRIKALEARLAYAKYLFLSHEMLVDDRKSQLHSEKIDAFIEKLNSEGL